MYKILLIPVMITMTACDSPDINAKYSAEANVSAQLKDPDSAKFCGIFIVRKPVNSDGFQKLATCGMVNSKNSYGGYAGNARFVVEQIQGKGVFDTSSTTIESPNSRRATAETMNSEKKESLFEATYWNGSCVDAAHPATYTGTNER